MPRNHFLLVLVLLAYAAPSSRAYHLCGTGPCEQDPQILTLPEEYLEDFQFELRNIYTDRQRGARLNIFTKFRYYTTGTASYYTTETGTFDYTTMEAVIMSYIPAGSMGVERDTFWEVLNRDMTTAIWKQFPIRGISIRIEVQGMSSGSIAGHRASTVTLGNIEPWVSIVNSFPGCDGMDTENGNKACRVVPTYTSTDPDAMNLSAIAAAKAGSHDKPRKCDFCG